MIRPVCEGMPVDHKQWPNEAFSLLRFRTRLTCRLLALGRRSNRISQRLRIVPQDHPSGGMIAGAFFPTNVTIHPCIDNSLGGLRAQQKMIDAEPRVALPPVPQIIPECVHRRIRMQRPDRIDPALVQNALKNWAS